ncbi:MAG: DEAD/DEAH box helicase, partial [Actinomycetaceae bacterium]|nr:DEAD/DEAH box helicase [Actinomycetaceae bacterium]
MHHHTPSYDEDTTTTFADLGLPSHLVDAVEKIGYTSPTDIQVRTIPHLLQGNDIIGIAQTGTGKTAAFSLPMLHFIDGKKKYPQALILVPTRELAIQGEQAINDFASTSHDIHVCAIYGGSSYAAQKRALKNGTQIIIGTPGRIIDL